MMFVLRALALRNFVESENRFPNQKSQSAYERSLAFWVTKVKQRQRYRTGTKALDQVEKDFLASIPGWDPSRYGRSRWTGTRKARGHFEARIKVGGAIS